MADNTLTPESRSNDKTRHIFPVKNAVSFSHKILLYKNKAWRVKKCRGSPKKNKFKEQKQKITAVYLYEGLHSQAGGQLFFNRGTTCELVTDSTGFKSK